MKTYGIFCADEIKINSVELHDLSEIIDNPAEDTFMDRAVLPKTIAPGLEPYIPKPLPQEISDLFGQQPAGSARIVHNNSVWYRQIASDVIFFKRAPIITGKVEELLNDYKMQLKNLEGKTTSPQSLVPWVAGPPVLPYLLHGLQFQDIALNAKEMPAEFKVAWPGEAMLAVMIEKESDSQIRIYLKPSQEFLEESARLSGEQGRQMPAWHMFKMPLATIAYEMPGFAK